MMKGEHGLEGGQSGGSTWCFHHEEGPFLKGCRSFVRKGWKAPKTDRRDARCNYYVWQVAKGKKSSIIVNVKRIGRGANSARRVEKPRVKAD